MDAVPPASDQAADENSFRYAGWRIVGVCFLLATFSWALGFYGHSVYLAELQRQHGWNTSLIAGATTFFYLIGAVMVAFLSDAIRAFGPRTCLIAGVLIMAGATALLGHIKTPSQLYGVYALLAVGWSGTSLGAVTNTLGLWFEKKRGMAISLALNGASFGGVAGVPLMVAAIGAHGFQTATLLAAIAMVAILVPAIVILIGKPPHRPTAADTSPSGSSAQIRSRAFRDPAFLTLAVAFALVLFAQVGFIVHLVSFLEPIVGRERAAGAVSLLTAMAVTGRLLVSTMIDRLDQRLASAVSFLSQTVSLILLLTSGNVAVIFLACGLFGFSVGNLITFPALIVQREFDPRIFGVLISLVTAVTQIAYAFGPGIIGVLRDATGGYAAPFIMCIALQIAAAVLILSRRKQR